MTIKKNNKHIIKTMQEIEEFKTCCKVSIINCMNSKDINLTMNCLKACFECIEICDICQFFIASDSINTKYCISFFIHVITNCIKKCTYTVSLRFL